VVASEVRALAQRSATAAKEISSLIGDSADRTALGAKQVADAGRTMGALVGSVQRVASMIGRISDSTSEQAHSIDRMSGSVQQLDEMTQRNAAPVEQSAAAADAIRREAARLSGLVAVFRFDGAAA
jgi:methyl-accepting chemotaxis protein